MKLGALEAGGTKMVCAIGDEAGHIEKRRIFPTRTPEETVPEMLDFFAAEKIEAMGIASFGPVDLRKGSETWGYITSTPKKGWADFNLCGAFIRELGVPAGFDTDVNGACLGELLYGNGRGCSSLVYITVGTGLGMGICADGRLIHGMLHPEAGHMLVRKAPGDDFRGICPYHGDCLEGLCCGPAIEARYGITARELPGEDPAWGYTAYYIAQAAMNLILTVSPERIIIGGGVLGHPGLLEAIRARTQQLLAGYLKSPLLQNMDTYIMEPGCGGDQGVLGALKLAEEAAKDDKGRKMWYNEKTDK